MASSRGEGLFFSKLGQNLSEMEVKTFTRIKKVIWDQLLATKAEIIKDKLYFLLRVKIYRINYGLNYKVSFFVVYSLPRSFFHLNHLRIVRKRFCLSTFSSQTIIMCFFYQNVVSCFSVAMGDYRFLWLRKRSTRSKINFGFVRFC